MLPSNPQGRTPTYDLEEVQRLAGQGPVSCRVTQVALDAGHVLGFNRDEIIEAVLELRPADFYKTMPSVQVPGAWQDVYHLSSGGKTLYIKLQINADGNAVVIQFKEK